MSEQTVYVARGWCQSDKPYHLSNDDCNAARRANNLTEIPLTEAEKRGFRECNACTREYDNANYDQSYQEALKAAARGEADD